MLEQVSKVLGSNIASEVYGLLEDGYTEYLDYPVCITTDRYISSGEDYLTGNDSISLFVLPIGSLLIEVI